MKCEKEKRGGRHFIITFTYVDNVIEAEVESGVIGLWTLSENEWKRCYMCFLLELKQIPSVGRAGVLTEPPVTIGHTLKSGRGEKVNEFTPSTSSSTSTHGSTTPTTSPNRTSEVRDYSTT